jgi:hypothetical protein
MIIDYSTSKPSISLLKAAGVTAVGRYIGWDSVPGYASMGKNLTKTEADELIAAGIEIFLSFEYAADAAAHGSTQGHADGSLTTTQLAQLGAPPSMASYFSVDFDLPDYAPSLPDTPVNALAKLGPVGQYFQAINSIKAAFEVGVYGGYYAVKRLLDAKLVTKAWQTVGWSGGQLDSRAVLYQVIGTPIAGADPDVREHSSTVADFGQWPRPGGSPPPPSPPPPPVPTMKETNMLHIKVTAPSASSSPSTSSDWAGKTRTFLYTPGEVPVHIVDAGTENAILLVLPVITVSWAQYQAMGGV